MRCGDILQLRRGTYEKLIHKPACDEMNLDTGEYIMDVGSGDNAFAKLVETET